MTIRLLTVSPVAALVRAAILALVLTLPTGTARADAASDAVSCIAGYAKATFDLDTIKKALEFLAKYPTCPPMLTDPSGQFQTMVGILVAAKVANVFASDQECLTTAKNCQGMIPTLAAKVIIGVADAIGDVIGLDVPPEIRDAFNANNMDVVQQWIDQVKDSNPAIKAIFQEMDCACAIAACGADMAEKALDNLVDAAKACGALLGDIVNALKEGLETAAKDIERIGEETWEAVATCLEIAVGQKSLADCLQELGDVGEAFWQGISEGATWFYCDLLGGFLSGYDEDSVPPMTPEQYYRWCKWLATQEPDILGKAYLDWQLKQCEQSSLNCQDVACSAGKQCGGPQRDRCVDCSSLSLFEFGNPVVVSGMAQDNGLCGCANGFTPGYTATPGGPILTGCKCDAPKVPVVPGCAAGDTACNIQGQLGGKAVCACPIAGQIVLNVMGTKQCSFCPLGQKPDPTGTKCINACNSGEILNGACKKCSENTRAVYLVAGSSLGSCEECGPGTSSPAVSTQCTPLNCGASGYQDPNDSHKCAYCPGTQIYIGPTIISSPGATETDKKVVKVSGHCGCDENQKLKGDQCVCAAGSIKQYWSLYQFSCACPKGGHIDKATFACVCPEGADLAADGLSCVCPPGMMCGPSLQPGLEKKKAPPKDCSVLGPNFINDPKNVARCIRCSGGRVANADLSECVRPETLSPRIIPSDSQGRPLQQRQQQIQRPQQQFRPPQQKFRQPVRRCSVIRGQTVCK